MLNKKISVVIPCFNEQENILPMYDRLKKTLDKVTVNYEIIYVNNGSTDNSDRVFRDLARKDKKVTVIFLSRNFYKAQGAYTAGMDYVTGDAAALIDGDLQDPPEVIPKMIDKWQEGFNIVYGVRKKREGSGLRKIGYTLFYRLFKKLSYVDIPLDAGDFSLIDRKVLAVINSMPERDRYIRGLRAWVGFKHTGVEYTRVERKRGVTTNSLLDNFRWAALGIFSFSYVPLELISWLAIAVVALSAIAIVGYTIAYFLLPEFNPQGFLTLLVAILFLGGIQLLCLSIIGQYLGKMFEEIKARPKYIISEILNDNRKRVKVSPQ